MGEAAAGGGSSIASIGLSVASTLNKGYGEQATQEFMAERDQRAADIGRIRAVQTDVHFREQLNTTLANIDAIRSAANIDLASPTSAVLKAEEARVSDRERMIKIANLRSQADEDELSAKYRYQVGKRALLGAYLSAGAQVLSAGKLSGGGGGSGSEGYYGGSPETNPNLRPY